MRISDWSSDVCSSDLDALEPHARIVDERGFVERQMRPVVEAHRDRRVRGRDRVDRSLLIELLVAVPFAPGDPPGGAPWHDLEVGDFDGDLRGWRQVGRASRRESVGTCVEISVGAAYSKKQTS